MDSSMKREKGGFLNLSAERCPTCCAILRPFRFRADWKNHPIRDFPGGFLWEGSKHNFFHQIGWNASVQSSSKCVRTQLDSIPLIMYIYMRFFSFLLFVTAEEPLQNSS